MLARVVWRRLELSTLMHYFGRLLRKVKCKKSTLHTHTRYRRRRRVFRRRLPSPAPVGLRLLAAGLRRRRSPLLVSAAAGLRRCR